MRPKAQILEEIWEAVETGLCPLCLGRLEEKDGGLQIFKCTRCDWKITDPELDLISDDLIQE